MKPYRSAQDKLPQTDCEKVSSVEVRAAKGATWLAIFNFSAQAVSWVATIIVARLLAPDDYGLMEMATIITGYAFIFNDLGLGQAIIQRPTVTRVQLSSIFWFSLLLSFFFALFALLIAYPTALIFNEPRVIPITQTTSILFILSGLQIIPQTLLNKEMRFQGIGFANMMGVLVSCISMVIIAKLGGGVWTLIGGHIIRSFTRLVVVYYITGWWPKFCFHFLETKRFIQFGVLVAIARSLFYVNEKSDRFFAGRAWPAQSLGLYSFALQLAMIPTEKIVPIINQVSYAAFAALQHEKERFNAYYLNITKVIATLTFPLFIGGFWLGNDLIKVFLTEQWYPMIPLFRYLCLAQVVVSMGAVNGIVHSAMGRPGRSITLNVIRIIFMPASFFIAVQHGVNAILIPWLTIYLTITITWLFYTLLKINISIISYLSSLKIPFIATTIMLFVIIFSEYIIGTTLSFVSTYVTLALDILIGAIVYVFTLWKLDKSLIKNLGVLIKKK